MSKSARVNLILITKYINLQLFTLFLYGFGVRFDHMQFAVLSPFTEKSMNKHIIQSSEICLNIAQALNSTLNEKFSRSSYMHCQNFTTLPFFHMDGVFMYLH